MLFTGVLLCLLMLLWMRAAVIIYALFFGLLPFPGLRHIAAMLFTTPTGWALLIVGTVVGALFAAFSFAISAFSIPMMLEERVDALTAMGTSMALVWNNLPVMLAWGAIVLALFLLSLATGLLGLIVVFPAAGTRNLACLSRHPAPMTRRIAAGEPCRSGPGLRQNELSVPGDPLRRLRRARSSACWRDLPGVERARVNLSTKRVTVAWRGERRRPRRGLERGGLRRPTSTIRRRRGRTAF